MGVPKFYRWISERYPCLSEVVREHEIPEFDNLYLDMNGIIHVCSHPNDDDPHFRITEENIFKDIFHYIEVLFRMIQPRKVFYMAVDGVAPRAKMNQQRGRRFRSAREAAENEKKALSKGEVLPTEARFDSNCITPGTEFMTKLDAQLHYFVRNKISTDPLWSDCSVIYSGHQTPGEGEHKIMEYIRYSKSQPEYDPNTRHCLYGLDADLMMLGLTSHEPHFSLLREEVRFGRQSKSSRRTPTAEETTFHLLHLSLMREYIDYEFSELKESLNFKYDLERVIDDWVFMGFLIGNDFIPHLPGLHINKGAFPVLFKTYKEVMPFLDGYLNEGGTLHLKRFEEFMKRLTEYDVEQFEETNSDLKYMHSKRGNVKKEETVDTRVERLEMFDFGNDADDEGFGVLEENTPLSSEEVRQKLAKLEISPQDEDLFFEDTDELNGEDAQFLAEFRQHKRNYYMFKMSYDNVTKDVLYEQATCYVRGLQWILNYYYNGICSWSWFYPHHYAPYISDINGFADMTMDFEFGTAFLPYEQLLAVLPPLSITLLPKAYEWLMLSSNSPLIEYYPTDFETDLNGKQQDWEAVVCIPFICEKSLLKAMKPCNERLNPAEKERNCHGPIHIFNYTSESTGEYRAPRYFPPIAINRAIVTEVWRKDWEMEPSKIIKGLLPSANLEVHFAGFPTLRHLPHGFQIQNKVVKVFDHDSRGESIILKITNQGEPSTEILDEHRELLDQEVFVGWPHLVEAKVTTVSSVNQRISVVEGNNEPKYEHLTKNEKDFWEAEVTDMRNKLLRRWGLSIGRTDYIIKAKVICGRSYAMTPNGKVTLEKNWSEKEQSFPYQTIVKDISVYNSDYKQYKTIEEYFSPKSKVFMLGEPHYGNMAEVLESDSECKGRIRISMTVPVEPDLTRIAQNFHLHGNKYHPPYVCAAKLGISTNMFSRITGTVWLLKAQELNPFAERDRSSMQMNIGLNLKNNKKMEETVGFSKRDREKSQWFYSEECVRNVETYLEKFPEVFLCMQKSDNKNELFADEIFADNYAERSKELADWLKNAPFAKAERCLFGSALVDHSSVEGVLAEVEEAAKQRAKLVKMQVKPHLLYKPNPLQGSTPLNPRVIFKLFDRVTNVREGFSVPLGATGTVIGIQEAERDCDKLYTVFFDSPFPAGLTLVGPKSAQRCYKLSWASLINRTFRQWESGAQGSNKAQFASLSNAMKQNPATYKKFSPGPGTQKNFNEQKIPTGQRPLMNDLPSNQSGRKHENQSHSLSSNYHPESRGHGNKGNSTRSERPQELEPPNPEALPKPFSFRSLLGGTNQGNDHQFTASSSSSPSAQNISFILHGNFYSNWSYIKENGIMADPRSRSIPCVSYDPESQGKRYQIHIYLSIKKLQADQIHYRVLSKGQVLCSPSFNNHIDPYYFDKVIDASNGRQIYEPNNAGPMKKPFNRNKNSNNYEYIGKGRGRRNDDDMTPMQRYDFINSQLEDYGGSQRNQESRKEVSLGDLFQSANRNSNDGLFRNLLPGGNPGVPYENAQPNSHFNSRNAPFVPTQVARKQTPTKTHLSDFSHPPPNVNAHQASNSNVNNQNSLPDKSKAKAKPRRGRSRIAANFNT